MPVNRDYINNLFLNYNKYRTKRMLRQDAEVETLRVTLIDARAGEADYCAILCGAIHAHINWRMHHRYVGLEKVAEALVTGVGYMASLARSATMIALRRPYGEAPPIGTPPPMGTSLLAVSSRPQTPTLTGEAEAVVSVHSTRDYAPLRTALSQQQADTTLASHEFEEVHAADHLYTAAAPDISGPIPLAATHTATTSIELFNLVIEHIHSAEFAQTFRPLLMSAAFTATVRHFVESQGGNAEEIYDYLVFPTVMKMYLREEAQAKRSRDEYARSEKERRTKGLPTAPSPPNTPNPTPIRQTAASAAHVAAAAARRAAAPGTSARIAAERRVAATLSLTARPPTPPPRSPTPPRVPTPPPPPVVETTALPPSAAGERRRKGK